MKTLPSKATSSSLHWSVRKETTDTEKAVLRDGFLRLQAWINEKEKEHGKKEQYQRRQYHFLIHAVFAPLLVHCKLLTELYIGDHLATQLIIQQTDQFRFLRLQLVTKYS